MNILNVIAFMTGILYAVGSTNYCTTEDPLSKHGVCSSSLHCASSGGQSKGKCGLTKVCCLYEKTCGESSSENPVYFQNEHYSQSEITTGTCSFDYHYGSHVCQVKLTFVDLFLAPGSSDGECSEDYFIVFNDKVVVSPVVCGDNPMNELTIDVAEGGGVLQAFVYRMSSSETVWNVEFTPINCGYEERNQIDDIIISALESLREGMVNGYPELGIPVLDPLHIDNIPLNVHANGTTLDGIMTDVTMNNLATFNTDYVHSNMLAFWAKVNLSIPILDTQGMYNMTGTVANTLPIYGSGPFTLDAMNVTLYVNIDLGIVQPDGFFGVTDINIELHTHHTKVEFEGIEGGGNAGDFINGVLSSMGADIFNSISDIVMPHLAEALKEEINNLIKG